jgi:hypothetical protein
MNLTALLIAGITATASLSNETKFKNFVDSLTEQQIAVSSEEFKQEIVKNQKEIKLEEFIASLSEEQISACSEEFKNLILQKK